jgi:hypothetical protein
MFDFPIAHGDDLSLKTSWKAKSLPLEPILMVERCPIHQTLMGGVNC